MIKITTTHLSAQIGARENTIKQTKNTLLFFSQVIYLDCHGNNR